MVQRKPPHSLGLNGLVGEVPSLQWRTVSSRGWWGLTAGGGRGSLGPQVSLCEATVCLPPVPYDMNETCLICLILWTVSDHRDVELFVTAFSLTELMQFLESIQVKRRRSTGGQHLLSGGQRDSWGCWLWSTIHCSFSQKPVWHFGYFPIYEANVLYHKEKNGWLITSKKKCKLYILEYKYASLALVRFGAISESWQNAGTQIGHHMLCLIFRVENISGITTSLKA